MCFNSSTFFSISVLLRFVLATDSTWVVRSNNNETHNPFPTTGNLTFIEVILVLYQNVPCLYSVLYLLTTLIFLKYSFRYFQCRFLMFLRNLPSINTDLDRIVSSSMSTGSNWACKCYVWPKIDHNKEQIMFTTNHKTDKFLTTVHSKYKNQSLIYTTKPQNKFIKPQLPHSSFLKKCILVTDN